MHNWRNHPVQRGHGGGGADLRSAAPSELPRQSGGEDQPGGRAESGTGFHFQPAAQPDSTCRCLSGPLALRHAPKPVPPLWLQPVGTWASPTLIPDQESQTFRPHRFAFCSSATSTQQTELKLHNFAVLFFNGREVGVTAATLSGVFKGHGEHAITTAALWLGFKLAVSRQQCRPQHQPEFHSLFREGYLES